MDTQDAFKEYFEEIAKIRSEMEENGGKNMRHKDLHAGQVLLYGMASKAQNEAGDAKELAEENKRWVRGITVVVGALLLINLEKIPEIVQTIISWIA